jgi:hypothetical protein
MVHFGKKYGKPGAKRPGRETDRETGKYRGDREETGGGGGTTSPARPGRPGGAVPGTTSPVV